MGRDHYLPPRETWWLRCWAVVDVLLFDVVGISVADLGTLNL